VASSLPSILASVNWLFGVDPVLWARHVQKERVNSAVRYTFILAKNLETKNTPRHSQRGYLVEIPLMLIILVLALSLLAPRLPLIGQKVLIGVAVVPIVFCLFYMIVVPGWVPGSSIRPRRA